MKKPNVLSYRRDNILGFVCLLPCSVNWCSFIPHASSKLKLALKVWLDSGSALCHKQYFITGGIPGGMHCLMLRLINGFEAWEFASSIGKFPTKFHLIIFIYWWLLPKSIIYYRLKCRLSNSIIFYTFIMCNFSVKKNFHSSPRAIWLTQGTVHT